jgi:hypothetical protein
LKWVGGFQHEIDAETVDATSNACTLDFNPRTSTPEPCSDRCTGQAVSIWVPGLAADFDRDKVWPVEQTFHLFLLCTFTFFSHLLPLPPPCFLFFLLLSSSPYCARVAPNCIDPTSTGAQSTMTENQR